jgi:hypothetical protein
MPRVHTTTKSNRGKTYKCVRCYEPITEGQVFYWWEKRFGGTYRQHQACGYPKPSQLSGRKTAVIEDVLGDLDLSSVTASLDPEQAVEADVVYDLQDVVDELVGLLEPVADTAREVGEEYEASADNMPESLQQGMQAEAMRDVAQRLQDWADEMADVGSSANTSVDLPDPADHTDDDGKVDEEAWRQACQDAIDEAVGELIAEAEGLVTDMPEYEG